MASAIRSRKLKAGTGRIEVSWDPDRRALTVQDNGIGMDTRTVLDVFLSLGSTGKGEAGDSEEAAGGFGVAKAVILGASRSFRWEIHTRDNLAISKGAGADVEVFEASYLQGTRITIFDVDPDYDQVWDYARQEYVGLKDRLEEMLAANDLKGITLVLDGEEVRPLFSRRGGSRVRLEGSWGRGTDARVKAYRRPPGDRQGAYYVRLGGLFQFKESARRGNLKADVVVDLVTTVRPGDHGYPLNAARDALQSRARWAFNDLVEEVERENESVGRSLDDEVFEPDAEDPRLRQGAGELADLAAEAFADEAFQRALAEAAGGIADFYAERVKDPGVEAPTDSHAPAGTKARPAEDQPTRGLVLPPGMKLAATPSTPGEAVRELRQVLEAADEVVLASGSGPISLTPQVQEVLNRATEGGELEAEEVAVLEGALERAAETAVTASGGGLLQAAAVVRAGAAAGVSPGKSKRNPFGHLAGLRISRKHYDRRRARRFKKRFDKWLPHLTVWDATLRLVAAEARIRRSFKPGFVLDDELLGLATTSGRGAVIYIHPDRLAQVVKAHKQRPLAIAAYLHGVACHELTHLDGRMGEGHNEEFVAAREDLGHATSHLLPAIAVLVQKVLGLPETADARRIAKLERQLDKARKGGRKARAEVRRLEGALARARQELEQARAESARVAAACVGPSCVDPAERVLDAALGALVGAPPAGVEATYVEGFAERHRAALLQVVRAHMEES